METDYRMEHILHNGDVIECGEASYTIEDVIGIGGSSIIYGAFATIMRGGARRKSKLRLAIKEWFPREPQNQFVRRNGIIQPKNPDDIEYLNLFRDAFMEELEKGEEIRNVTNKVISLQGILNPTAIYVDGKKECAEETCRGLFAVMERQDQKGITFRQLLDDIALPPSKAYPLRTGGFPTIHTTAMIIEKVLMALKPVHEKANFLFGDIQEGNIIFTDADLAEGSIGEANLLDFGCAKALDTDKKTAPIADKRIFSTYGYVPPEMVYCNDGSLQLGLEADIFSVGALMLRCLLPEVFLDSLGKSPCIDDEIIQSDEGNNLGATEKIRNSLNSLLYYAMHPDRTQRCPDAAAMLKSIRQLAADTEPPKYRLPDNLSSPVYFVPGSRNDELELLTQAIHDNRMIFIHGVGGIGKSETARLLAKTLNPPRGKFLIHYQNSMRETIMNLDFSGFTFHAPQDLSKEAAQEMEYQKRLQILRDYYQDTVIVIDNFNLDNCSLEDLQAEPAYRDITEISGISFIFTTRYEILEHPEWEIKAMDERASMTLLKKYCPAVPEILLKDIIEEVHGHTLTLSLIGKGIRESCGTLTAAQVLHALRHHTFSEMNSPVISSDKDRKFMQAEIYAHLRILFNLSSLNEFQKSAMIFAAFIPGAGIPYPVLVGALWHQSREIYNELDKSDEDFRQLPRVCHQTVRTLKKRGWLKIDSENTITIHPVIQEIAIEELKPSEDNCMAGLEQVEAHWGRKLHSGSSQLGGFFSRAGTILQMEWFTNIGADIREKLAKQEAALAPHIRALKLAQNNAESSELADRYEQLGLLCFGLDGCGKEAVNNCLAALRLRENNPQTTRNQLAWSLFYTGLAYQKLHGERYSKLSKSDSLFLADDYHRRALELWKGLPPNGVTFFHVDHDNYFTTAYRQMLFDYCYSRIPENPEYSSKILYWLGVSATLEDVPSMLSLARRYRDGTDCRKDLKQSYYWASTAVAVQSRLDSIKVANAEETRIDNGTVYHSIYYRKPAICAARVFLAAQIINGIYYTPSPEEKTYWTWYAAEAGDLSYMIRYASCLLTGEGCREDREEAFVWLKKVTEIAVTADKHDWIYRDNDSWPYMHANDAYKTRLNLLDRAWKLIQRHFDQAHLLEWYRCIATSKRPQYAEKFGKLLLEMASSEEEYREAFRIFQKLSSRGSAMATYYLGWMYMNGFAEGNLLDISRGISLYTSAAFDGCPEASLALVRIYLGLDPKTAGHEPPDPCMALTFCNFAAFGHEMDYGDSKVITDVLQAIEQWEAAFPDTRWSSEVYFTLADFFRTYAPETHGEKAEACLAKAYELRKTEPKKQLLPTSGQTTDEIVASLEASLQALEELLDSD